jgi:hypothetical protein
VHGKRDSFVAGYGCSAIALWLSSSPEGLARLGRAGACEGDANFVKSKLKALQIQ